MSAAGVTAKSRYRAMNPTEDGLPKPQRYWAILTLMVGLAMSCLDTAIVNVALPVIARDLHTSAADSIWVVNAYQLAVMISLLPFASFGDIFGYRRVYRFGLVLYTGAALVSALSTSLEMLTLGRALQGLGAAGLMSVNTALVRFTYPRRQLAQGIAFVALPFYFHDVIGASAVETGLLITPWAVMTAILAPIAGYLADRHPAGILGGIGLAVLASGFVLLALLPADPTTADIVWRVALCGAGFGLFQSPNNRAIVASAPRHRSGGAGAIQGTARLLGQSIGAALVALVFGVAGGGHGAATAILIAAGFAGIAVIASLTRLFEFVRLPPAPQPHSAASAGLHEPAE